MEAKGSTLQLIDCDGKVLELFFGESIVQVYIDSSVNQYISNRSS